VGRKATFSADPRCQLPDGSRYRPTTSQPDGKGGILRQLEGPHQEAVQTTHASVEIFTNWQPRRCSQHSCEASPDRGDDQ
jgi:hypothetical protein